MAHDSLHRREQAQASSDRVLGLVFATVFLAIALFPWLFGGGLRLWALVAGGAFATTALLLPSLLAPLNRVWTQFGMLLHKVMSPLVLGIMFFLVITPMGLVMRWLGKDPLRLHVDRELPSYWLDRSPRGPKPDTFSDQF